MSADGEFEGKFRAGFDLALEDHQQVLLEGEYVDDADDRIVQVEPTTRRALDRAVGRFLAQAGDRCLALEEQVGAQVLGGCLYYEWAGFGLRYADRVASASDASALRDAAAATGIDGFLAAFVRDEDGSVSMEPISLARLDTDGA